MSLKFFGAAANPILLGKNPVFTDAGFIYLFRYHNKKEKKERITTAISNRFDNQYILSRSLDSCFMVAFYYLPIKLHFRYLTVIVLFGLFGLFVFLFFCFF